MEDTDTLETERESICEGCLLEVAAQGGLSTPCRSKAVRVAANGTIPWDISTLIDRVSKGTAVDILAVGVKP